MQSLLNPVQDVSHAALLGCHDAPVAVLIFCSCQLQLTPDAVPFQHGHFCVLSSFVV